MAIIPSTPESHLVREHTVSLESLLRSAEVATAPDHYVLWQNEEGGVMVAGLLREVTRNLRKVAQYLESQEPQTPVALNIGQAQSLNATRPGSDFDGMR